MNGTLRIGTRGSRLALAQTSMVAEMLRAAHPHLEVETIIIQTTGDKILDSSLSRIGGKGVFTREIELALLDGRVDLAVHSLKDLPVVQPKGLALGAVTERERVNDILIAREPISLRELKAGDRLGTSSLRRQAQVRAINMSVEIADLRGNVPTRIQKMLNGDYTAILLAAAGVRRLGLDAPYINEISFDELLPAPGQGSIGIQIREGDARVKDLLRPLHHEGSARCCGAERALLQGLGGGCQLPLGTVALIAGDELHLRGRVIAMDGSKVIEDEIRGLSVEWEALGKELAERLLARGAREVLNTVMGGLPEVGFEEAVARAEAMNRLPLGGRTVLITRDEDADGPLSRALRDRGANPLCLPLVQHEPPEDAEPLRREAARIDNYDWVVLTSARAVDALAGELGSLGIRPKIAVVGRGTERRVEERGGQTALVPDVFTAVGLANAFEAAGGLAGQRVLYPRADRAKPTLADALRRLGADLCEVIAYRTITTAGAAHVVHELREGRVDAVLFASASAAEALGAGLEPEELAAFERVVIGAIGPTTAGALRAVGVEPTFEAEEKTFEGLVDGLVTALGAKRNA